MILYLDVDIYEYLSIPVNIPQWPLNTLFFKKPFKKQ